MVFLGGLAFSARASFSALYAFGDGVCTTTNNAYPGVQYYGKRYTNGRVWLEVLAQRQGLAYDYTKNRSFYGNYSTILVTNISKFVAPPDVANDLFVIWVCDADFVSDMGAISPYSNLTAWNNAIALSLTNHYSIITNLYAKGVRTLILPTAVDITEVPYYSGMSSTSDKAFIRGRCNYFNTNLVALAGQIKKMHPDLNIYVPDIFSLLDNVLTNAASYGLTNALLNGHTTYATSYYGTQAATNGLGTNFVFWDYLDPSAQMHEIIADTVQQMISPVQINSLAQINGSNQLNIVNMPVGLNGYLDGSTNLAQASNWTLVTNFNSTSTAQSIFVVTPPLPAGFGAGGSGGAGGLSGPPIPGQGSGSGTGSSQTSTFNSQVAVQFYRLRFPYAWQWP